MVTLWRKITSRVSEFFDSRRRAAAARIAAELLTKGQLGLELHYVDTPEAEVAEKLAEAASKLIASLSNIDQAIIRAGPILVVKLTRDGVSQIAAETMSPQIRKALDANPKMLREPENLFDFLQKHREQQRQLKDEPKATTSTP